MGSPKITCFAFLCIFKVIAVYSQTIDISGIISQEVVSQNYGSTIPSPGAVTYVIKPVLQPEPYFQQNVPIVPSFNSFPAAPVIVSGCGKDNDLSELLYLLLFTRLGRGGSRGGCGGCGGGCCGGCGGGFNGGYNGGFGGGCGCGFGGGCNFGYGGYGCGYGSGSGFNGGCGGGSFGCCNNGFNNGYGYDCASGFGGGNNCGCPSFSMNTGSGPVDVYGVLPGDEIIIS